MDLIYYYPWGGGAPSNVAKNVFKHLLKREKELPFESLKLFVSSKYAGGVQKQFNNIEVLTYRDLYSISKNDMIHIHHVSLVFPNAKFLLYLFAVFKKRKLILRMPGEIRTELLLKLKYEHSLKFFNIPTYIAISSILKSADKVITHSYLMSNLLRSKYGVENVLVISNGIDDFWFEESNKTNIELDGDPNLFYHGRLSPEKGVDLLIKGFAKAIREYPKAKLYVAASGSQRENLESLCRKLGIKKNVAFLGYLNINYIKSYLSNADAAIYPSIWDNFPAAFMEAFSSAKCPVYFSKQAGIYDFVVRDGYDLNAFVPTVENIVEIIKDIIDGNYDKQVVRLQREFAKQYTWDKVINQYIELYNQMCPI